MKTYLNILLLMLGLFLVSCEDVIDVEVQTAATRLTIEASLDWEKGTSGNEQMIKLSSSTAYFDNATDPQVTGASVKVIDNNNATEFVFEDQNNGEYITSNFIPVINRSYSLEVVYNGETYSATETLMPVADITALTQSTEDGIDDSVLEVNISFIDPEEADNYYLIKLKERDDLLVKLFDVDDEFTNGNEIKLYYERHEDLDTNTKEFEAGDIVDVELLGISEAYFNYISILIKQSESSGPFGSIPVALKGNCVNSDNPDNYAYGYFRLTQVEKESYTFE